MMREDTLPLSVRIDKNLRRNLNIATKLQGRTIRAVVERALRRELARKDRS